MNAERVREATGRGPEEWFALLDAAGAQDMDHKAIVAVLEREHPEVSAWWRQSLTVEYERARGKRLVGQTADAGFQVGVTRTFDVGLDEAWELIASRTDLWLGEDVALEPGERCARGEIRVVKPRDRVRLRWRPDGWDEPATLQLTLQERRPGRTAIGAHLERLPDASAREAMRSYWRGVLERLASGE
jgi:uncharacterized protein YndB with AHSA1/START domain